MTDWLESAPRVSLAHAPTPLEPLPRLTKALGGPRLWIKRDDCTGLATGGNKTRKLEYLIGAALAEQADAVITFGAVQSNHARQTAAACAAHGLECHLILARSVAWDHPDYETAGNVLLDEILGAHLHLCEPAAAQAIRTELEQRLAADGKTAFVIPAGGSNATGALGYVRCARELTTQIEALDLQPDGLVHATSSGGTQAGLVAGFADVGIDLKVLGINVYDPNGAAIEKRVRSLVEDIRGLAPDLAGRELAIDIDHSHVGSGYGHPTADTIRGIQQLAQAEGIITDPVYSGKALGAMISLIENGQLGAAGDVIFLHTGGVAVQSVYQPAFARPTV